MRGLVALKRLRLAGLDARARPCLGRIDLRAQHLGIFFRDKTLHRHRDEIRIAQIFAAVGIGEFRGFGEKMERFSRIMTSRLEVEAFEQVENLDQMHASRRWRRHRDDFMATVLAFDNLPLNGAVGFEISGSPSSARFIDGRHHFLGDWAFIEDAGSAIGDSIQRIGQILLFQLGSPGQCKAVGVGKDLHGGFKAFQAWLRLFEREGQIIAHQKALARQFDGGLDQLAQGEATGAEALQRHGHARDGAGNAHAQARILAAEEICLAHLVDIARLGHGGGGRLTKVDGFRLLAIRPVHDHEAAAADIAGTGQGHCQGEADRDRCIHRIAALLENLHADTRGQRLLRGHHAAARKDRLAAWPIRDDGLKGR